MILALLVLAAVPADTPPDGEAMVTYLIMVLEDSGVYEETFPDNVLLIVEEEDSSTCRDSFEHYFDIALRENHTPETGGDPVTAPVIDRFRVYRGGEILYFNPVAGMYVPYEDFLEGIMEL